MNKFQCWAPDNELFLAGATWLFPALMALVVIFQVPQGNPKCWLSGTTLITAYSKPSTAEPRPFLPACHCLTLYCYHTSAW